MKYDSQSDEGINVNEEQKQNQTQTVLLHYEQVTICGM